MHSRRGVVTDDLCLRCTPFRVQGSPHAIAYPTCAGLARHIRQRDFHLRLLLSSRRSGEVVSDPLRLLPLISPRSANTPTKGTMASKTVEFCHISRPLAAYCSFRVVVHPTQAALEKFEVNRSKWRRGGMMSCHSHELQGPRLMISSHIDVYARGDRLTKPC